MRLAKQSAAVFVTADGRNVLAAASIHSLEAGPILVDIEESEDLGLWLRVLRETETHLFLLRWEYIEAIDLADPAARVTGLQSEKALG